MPEDDEHDLSARREKLAAELNAARPKPAVAPLTQPGSAGAAWSMGTKAASEFVAAVVVGGAIGWGLDWAAHTKPLFTILFFLIGVAAGVWGVVRATSPKVGK